MAAQLDFSDVVDWAWDGPDSALIGRKARLLLLDSLGCALSGMRYGRTRQLAGAMAAWMPGSIRLPGRTPPLSLGGAAAVLATAMCWDEANDGLARAGGRPGLPAAALALAGLEAGRLTLGETVTVYALGYEVAARGGEVWRLAPGMHPDGSWHALGAAAAAARIVGGSRATAARAVRLAACQVPLAMYAPIGAGMDGRNSYACHAVLLGLAAAANGEAGLDAPGEALDEARLVVAPRKEEPPVYTGPGRWLLAEGYLKPFAGVRHTHYGAAAALRLHPSVGYRLEAIRSIRLVTYGEAIALCGGRSPRTSVAAQHSLSWACAAALARGNLDPDSFNETALGDPRIRALESRIEIVEDPSYTAAARRAAHLTLEMSDGTLSARAEPVLGDPESPMSETEAVAKFRAFAGTSLGDAQAKALVEAVLLGSQDGKLTGKLFAGA
jgi:2-methylcitrate dehydratase PrpD